MKCGEKLKNPQSSLFSGQETIQRIRIKDVGTTAQQKENRF